MKIQSFFTSVRSIRILSVALPLAALICAAPMTRANSAPTSPHIYLFDPIFGVTDVTATFDGASVVNITGDVVYINFVATPDNGATGAGQHTTDLATGAGQHTTDIATGAGQHTTDLATGAGQHTTDLVVDDSNFIVGFVAP